MFRACANHAGSITATQSSTIPERYKSVRNVERQTAGTKQEGNKMEITYKGITMFADGKGRIFFLLDGEAIYTNADVKTSAEMIRKIWK